MNNRMSLVVFGSLVSALAVVGCRDSFKNCENNATCPPEGDGDGDTSTGGVAGDGDGDGDGDAAGGGDGDTGGTGGGTGGGDGDGDGDSTGGMGGDPNDPCLLCGGVTPYCDAEDECVECLSSNHCATTETPVCDTAVGDCVECNASEDCDDPALPMCESNVCVAGCAVPEDCTRFGTLNSCDVESGVCVACTPETEEADCGAKSCDPATFECGPNDRESRGTCSSCVSDSDCTANHYCVPMEYPTGTEREGGYCLELSGACAEPYTVVLSNRSTLSGTTGETYCGISEDLATCEAVRALENNWRCDRNGPGDGQCWPSGGTVADAVETPGAICRQFSGLAGDRCTYACGVVTDCLPSGPASTCGAGTDPDPVTPNYCGGM